MEESIWPLTPTTVGVICLCLFVASESILRRGSAAKGYKPGKSDHGTSLQLALSYLVCICLLVTPAFFHWPRLEVGYRWAGCGLALGGLTLRWWSTRVLGQFYTRTLVTTGDQTIIRNGPYRVIRNPGYLGSLFTWMGASLALAPVTAFVLITLILLVAYIRRIAREEQMLYAQFGPAYDNYRDATWRLVPLFY